MNKDAHYYLREIKNAQDRAEDWRKECAETEKIYTSAQRFNVLFSNTQLLLSALACNDPKPVVRVRFAKQNSPSAPERNLSTVVGEVTERAVMYNNEATQFKAVIPALVQNALLTGRGALWLNYETNIEAQDPDIPQELPQEGQNITVQKVRAETLGYKEFLTGYAHKWADVSWVARRHIMTREDLSKKFGEELAGNIPLAYRQQETGKNKRQASCAAVWEVWDKESREVVFVAENYPQILQTIDDPLGLPNFFPCPEPLRFIDGGNLTPVPEYRIYKKTAKELERIARRIDILVRSIKATAVAPGSIAKELNDMAEETDGTVLTVDNVDLGANGGLKGIISEYPNEGKSAVLSVLESRKQNALQEIYDITGIADILRGQGSPEETATASRIKGVFGSLRLKSRQRQLQQFIRDVFKLTVDVICETFTPQILASLTCVELPTEEQKAQARMTAQQLSVQGQPVPPALADTLKRPTWDEVITTMREDHLRSFTIEVESTATDLEESETEKQKRLELFQGTVNTLKEALPLMGQEPALIGLIKNLLTFSIDGFSNSRVLKESVDAALNQLEQKLLSAKPNPGPTPEQTLAQAEMLKAQAEMEKAKLKQQEVQLHAAELSDKQQLEVAKLEEKTAKDGADTRVKQTEVLLKTRKDFQA